MRHLLLHGSHYVATLVVCLAAIGPLARARWLWRVPRVGLLLWQGLALAVVLSLVGLFVAAGLAPYGRGVAWGLARLAGAVVTAAPTGLTVPHLVAVGLGLGLAGAVVAAMLWHLVSVARLRARHRSRLALAADPDPTDPTLLRVDHPVAAAYCLPDLLRRRGTVVVTAGAVDRLEPDQLAAVLAHEHSHARERHDLVLLPFAALHRVAPWSRLLARAYAAVSLLVEMRADDRALRHHSPQCLAGALRAVGDGRVPGGALGAADEQVRVRLQRIADPPPRRRLTPTVALLVAVTVAATPLSLYLLP